MGGDTVKVREHLQLEGIRSPYPGLIDLMMVGSYGALR